MKNNKRIWLVFFMVLGLISISYAAECGANPVENCDVSTSTVFNISKSPYYLNDTDADGAIRVNESDVILDFNLSNFYGNLSTGSIAVKLGSGVNNITLQNMNITSENYTYALRVGSTSQIDFTSMSSTIRNISYDYDSTAKSFTMECEGTGTILVSNLNLLKGELGTYEVYKDNIFQSYQSSNTYTVSGCSTWYFVTTSNLRSQMTATESTLYFFVGFFIVFGAVFALLGGSMTLVGTIMIIIGGSIAAILVGSIL